jgi:ketosteroid isomerase-like protein
MESDVATEDPITVISHEIRDLIDRINRTWLKGEPADLVEFFHQDIVIQPPGDGPRVHGIDDCIASYEDFVRDAHFKRFTPGDAEIDVFGDTAIATYRYRIVYELGADTHDEAAGELLVFLQEDERWKVAWRALLA